MKAGATTEASRTLMTRLALPGASFDLELKCNLKDADGNTIGTFDVANNGTGCLRIGGVYFLF